MAQPAGKKNKKITVYIILIVILLVVVVVGMLLRNRPQATSEASPTAIPASEMVGIVITTQTISQGMQFTNEVLTTIPYPKSSLVEGTFYYDINEVVGKRARYDMDARIPVTHTMVVDQPTGSMASFLIPAGMTAYSIPINGNNSVSYAPKTGDHIMLIGCLSLVDIDEDLQTRLPNLTGVVTSPGSTESMYTLSAAIAPNIQGRIEIDSSLNQAVYVIPSESQRPRLTCQTVLQDAAILHVGDFALGSSATSTAMDAAEATMQNEEGVPLNPTRITLIVSPQDAIILTYLQQANASFSMALRSAGDLQTYSTSAVTLNFVMEQKGIQLPVKLPYGIYPTILDQIAALGN